jgi:hypothetical protein
MRIRLKIEKIEVSNRAGICPRFEDDEFTFLARAFALEKLCPFFLDSIVCVIRPKPMPKMAFLACPI